MIKNPYVILALIIALGGLLFLAYNKGRKDCETAHALAQAEAAKVSRVTNEGIDKGYDLASKEIRKAPDGGCVGPAAGSASDWLRSHYR